jgi:sterol desaturase/sphingolipid hydroxylase (fatty acid hydroxylase superfamily)
MSARTSRWQRLNEGLLRLALRAQHPMLYRRYGRTLDLEVRDFEPRPSGRAAMPLSRRTEWIVMTVFAVCLAAGIATGAVLATEGRWALAAGALAAALAVAYMVLTFVVAIALAVAHRGRAGRSGAS